MVLAALAPFLVGLVLVVGIVLVVISLFRSYDDFLAEDFQ